MKNVPGTRRAGRICASDWLFPPHKIEVPALVFWREEYFYFLTCILWEQMVNRPFFPQTIVSESPDCLAFLSKSYGL